MRRIALIACAVALAGCGASGSSASDFEGEEREVADVVEELQSAGERRDGARICKELLAEKVVEQLESGGTACSEELDDALREADDSSLEVTGVEISGSTATVNVTGKEGNEDRSATFRLVKENGAWRIESLG